jgi:hypothetical protein
MNLNRQCVQMSYYCCLSRGKLGLRVVVSSTTEGTHQPVGDESSSSGIVSFQNNSPSQISGSGNTQYYRSSLSDKPGRHSLFQPVFSLQGDSPSLEGIRKRTFLSKRLTLRRERMLEDMELEKRKCSACGTETLTNQGGTHCFNLYSLCREILLLCSELQIQLVVRHIPGHLNVLADTVYKNDLARFPSHLLKDLGKKPEGRECVSEHSFPRD